MSLLDELCSREYFQLWSTEGGQQPLRYFWYSDLWAKGYNSLNKGKQSASMERDSSERGRITGLINDYVCGVPIARLATPLGYGSEPVIKRLDPPRNSIVYFRTGITQKPASPGVRCFGFFRQPNCFFALAMMRKMPRKRNFDPVDAAVKPIETLLRRIVSEVDTTTDVEKLITP